MLLGAHPTRLVAPGVRLPPFLPTNQEQSMLVLSRRVRESFLIGDDIVITIAQVRGRRVHLIVNAPQSTSIGRLIAPGPTPGRDTGRGICAKRGRSVGPRISQPASGVRP
jgi:carbon storage regulator